MRTIALPSGEPIPILGQGTWHMAERRRHAAQELKSLRLGIDLGMTLIDTAEMYAHGRAEQLVGEAVTGRRDEVFLVSKVLPSHATRQGTIDACHRSLQRLGTDRLDLYLLHWRGRVPLAETVEGFTALVDAGLIRYWGVSNFDVADMRELVAVPGGDAVAANQVLYHLGQRSIEHGVLPWSQRAGVPIMAYTPLGQGRLLRHAVLQALARRHEATAAQIALAWVVSHAGVDAIPQTSVPAHVQENGAAAEISLSAQDLADLDGAFPRPRGAPPLEML
jgi:diketogulonate reductase-like aldo/keto reductase